MSKWTVWVGGMEVNTSYLTLYEAQAIAKEYKYQGYNDVEIERVIPTKAEEAQDHGRCGKCGGTIYECDC